MLLKKLKLQNIRSYKDAEIEFPEGSILLMGDIGSGKTSVLLAIEFALFGLQPSQRGSSLLRNNEDEAFVSLEFEVEGKQVTIERRLKRSTKSISHLEASITIDKIKEEGSVTEIKNRVLQLLNYPPEFAKKTNDLYKYTVYTPQEEMKQIVLEPPETRLNALRHVFGIDKYKRISENLELSATRMRQEIRIKEAQMEDAEEIKKAIGSRRQSIAEEENKGRELEKEITKIQLEKAEKQSQQKELEAKINEKRDLQREREKAELMLNHKNEQIAIFDKELASLKHQIEGGKKFSYKEEEISFLKDRITRQEQILRGLNDELLSISSKIKSHELKKREAESLKSKISGMKKCPTCLQEVDENYKRNILTMASEEIDAIDEQNLVDNKNKNEFMQKAEQIRKQVDSLKNSLAEKEILKVKLQSLAEKEKRAAELEEQRALSREGVVNTVSKIKRLAEIVSGFEQYSNIFEQTNIELEKITAKENQLQIAKAELNKEMQFLARQIRELEERLKKLEELSAKINYLKEIESWLSNKFSQFVLYTEKNVMLKLRGEFSELFSKWFSVLVGEELNVRLDETFTPIIQQRDYELEYNFLSGGERTAVALAYRLALNQVINSVLSKIKTRDIVILDEPTDGFSESQLEKMRDVFQQLKVRQLILVSHEQKIEGFVNNIIRFKKVDGVTRIER